MTANQDTNAYTASVCQGDGNERRKGNRDSRTARFEDWRAVWKIEEAIDAMHYRRMVGNLFRRVADAVDGG